MKKTQQTIISILSFIIILALAAPVLADYCANIFIAENSNIAIYSHCTEAGTLTVGSSGVTSLIGMEKTFVSSSRVHPFSPKKSNRTVRVYCLFNTAGVKSIRK